MKLLNRFFLTIGWRPQTLVHRWRSRGWGFHTVRGDIRPSVAFPGCSFHTGAVSTRVVNALGSVVRCGSTTTHPRWVLHTVRGGIDPRDNRFGPRFMGVVEAWKGFVIRGRDLYPPPTVLDEPEPISD